MRRGSAAMTPPPRFFSHKATQRTTKPMCSLCSLWLNNERNKTMKLHEAIKGMEVKSWEAREHSSGKRKVYVRFVPKKPVETMNVKEVE